jgi:hypothetical protein
MWLVVMLRYGKYFQNREVIGVSVMDSASRMDAVQIQIETRGASPYRSGWFTYPEEMREWLDRNLTDEPVIENEGPIPESNQSELGDS